MSEKIWYTEIELLALETDNKRIINATSNKIEFQNGDVYAKQSLGSYKKVKCFTL